MTNSHFIPSMSKRSVIQASPPQIHLLHPLRLLAKFQWPLPRHLTGRTPAFYFHSNSCRLPQYRGTLRAASGRLPACTAGKEFGARRASGIFRGSAPRGIGSGRLRRRVRCDWREGRLGFVGASPATTASPTHHPPSQTAHTMLDSISHRHFSAS